MKKLAKDLIKGNKIKIADNFFVIEEIEISDIGKQGKRKVRIVVTSNQSNEKLTLIRPDDYPFEVIHNDL